MLIRTSMDRLVHSFTFANQFFLCWHLCWPPMYLKGWSWVKCWITWPNQNSLHFIVSRRGSWNPTRAGTVLRTKSLVPSYMHKIWNRLECQILISIAAQSTSHIPTRRLVCERLSTTSTSRVLCFSFVTNVNFALVSAGLHSIFICLLMQLTITFRICLLGWLVRLRFCILTLFTVCFVWKEFH